MLAIIVIAMYIPFEQQICLNFSHQSQYRMYVCDVCVCSLCVVWWYVLCYVRSV